uniref:Uncharacterized protein n=1 Tax=Rousettus aegyptiacus TaxID=9407 RepID=A0A7J8JI30_ROUAE|nr:hypothetical protein HJG63_010409 [Rousettus aegyptiacus]
MQFSPDSILRPAWPAAASSKGIAINSAVLIPLQGARRLPRRRSREGRGGACTGGARQEQLHPPRNGSTHQEMTPPTRKRLHPPRDGSTHHGTHTHTPRQQPPETAPGRCAQRSHREPRAHPRHPNHGTLSSMDLPATPWPRLPAGAPSRPALLPLASPGFSTWPARPASLPVGTSSTNSLRR